MPQQKFGNTPNGRVAWQCTCFNVRRAARAISQIYDDALEPSGLRINQFSLLGAIEATGPAPVSELALLM